MLYYASMKNLNPVGYNAFHNFIKAKLHVEVTKNQVQDKIRRLIKKFKNNIAKRSFLRLHEEMSFELS